MQDRGTQGHVAWVTGHVASGTHPRALLGDVGVRLSCRLSIVAFARLLGEWGHQGLVDGRWEDDRASMPISMHDFDPSA